MAGALRLSVVVSVLALGCYCGERHGSDADSNQAAARAPLPPVGPPSASPPPPMADPRPGVVARVAEVKGRVERRPSASGPWSPLVSDQPLELKDEVRTVGSAQVDVTVDAVRVRLHEDSSLSLDAVEPRRVALRVSGRIEGEVTPGEAELTMTTAGSGAVVKSRGGRLSMIADGRGVVAVAVTRGVASVSSGGREVEVPEGRMSVVVSDRAPEPPSAPLRRVLMNVSWPGESMRVTKEPRILVKGTARPGTRVYVQGQRAAVDGRGRFTGPAVLKPGQQRLRVRWVDAFGRSGEVMGPSVDYDPLGNRLRAKVGAWGQ